MNQRGLFVFLLALAIGSNAGAYTDLVVFGDSLSDAGNSTSVSLGVVPGAAYWKGRYSNGPIYVERLAKHLELGEVKCSNAGGNIFASGGAHTSGTKGNREAFVDDLDEQVARFLARKKVDSQALYVIWIGANDLLDGQRNVKVPVTNIGKSLTKLYDAGARRFLVMNLPQLGSAPRYHRRPDRAKYMNKLTLDFNQRLARELNRIDRRLGEAELLRFDIQAYFEDVVANPDKFGLTDTRNSAAPGLDVGTFLYDKRVISPTPEKFLYWDIVHPTTTMHAQLADSLHAFLQEQDEQHPVGSTAAGGE
ncbi:SGNH/GDSL hydrolase family protein [Aeoliella sp.]|uniref:SGNH/GDSL hydrolase family protein n=1 Tax=Aeoliella sp. TaxID=2795800 RepID=UPI003CCBE9A4